MIRRVRQPRFRSPRRPSMMRVWSSHLIVHINGNPCEVNAKLSVAGLLAQLGLESGVVAVEQNQEIVPRSRQATTDVAEGDRFEIVTMVGGG